MEFKLVPAKNQKFDIGRTINFTKCDCKKCDFMHCPKNNYALKMVRKKYSVQDFFNENKEQIVKHSCLGNYFTYDTVADFIDSCVGNFPKGTYWRLCGHEHVTSIYLCSQNRGKYGEDFIDKAEIDLHYVPFRVLCYSGCTDGQERLANKISLLFEDLEELFEAERS